MSFRFTQRYRDHLLENFHIPTKGAFQIVSSTRIHTQKYLEYAFSEIQKDLRFASSPLNIILDFQDENYSAQVGRVIIKIEAHSNGEIKKEKSLDVPAYTQFPSFKMPGQVTMERLIIAIHEFGHAYTYTLFGHRFSHVVLEPTSENSNPHVSGFLPNLSQPKDLITQIMISLGSRVFERMFLSDNNMDTSNFSRMNLTTGSMSDLENATNILYSMLHELGWNPYGYSIALHQNKSTLREAAANRGHMGDMPVSEIRKMGRVLQSLENYLMETVLKIHSPEWYVEKINVLAKEGKMTEIEFYQLIDLPYPGKTKEVLWGRKVHRGFQEILMPPPSDIVQAGITKYGDDGLNIEERTEALQQTFIEILKRYFEKKKK